MFSLLLEFYLENVFLQIYTYVPLIITQSISSSFYYLHKYSVSLYYVLE